MSATASPISPVQFAHAAFITRQKDVLRDWYCTVLGAFVMHEDDIFCFLTYDDEHHRLVLLQSDAAPPAPRDAIGLHHIAYAYASLEDLLVTYERLKAAGITPWLPVNHGITTSMYYRDPDGHSVELQIDNFESADDTLAWMQTGALAHNPIGVSFDPDELLARMRAGEAIDPLREYKNAN